MKNRELETLYYSVMNREVDKVTEMINNSEFTKPVILRKLREYSAEVHSENDIAFKYNYKFCMSMKFNYFRISYLMIKKYEDSKELPQISDFTVISYLNHFKNNFREYSKIVNEIIDKLLDSKGELQFYDKIDNHFSKYEDEFNQILNSENPISVYKKFNWNEKTFYKKLELFKAKYTSKNCKKIADYFEEQYKLYLNTYVTKKVAFEYRKDNISSSNEMFKNLLSSKCSIYEFCDQHLEYDVSNVKKQIELLCGSKSNEIIDKLNKLENPRLQCKLEYIAYQIINNPNFTIVDYYLLTKLKLSDFYSRIIIRDSKLSKFIANNCALQYNRRYNSICYFSKEQAFKSIRIVKGKSLTYEEKQMIFNFLENNNIPIDQFTYKTCENKLLNGDLDFEQKIKVYKGSF